MSFKTRKQWNAISHKQALFNVIWNTLQFDNSIIKELNKKTNSEIYKTLTILSSSFACNAMDLCNSIKSMRMLLYFLSLFKYKQH